MQFHIESWLEKRANHSSSKEAMRRRTKLQVDEIKVLTKRKDTAKFLAEGFQGPLSQ
ncbi:hypothetical protein AJ90_21065 [Vibrio parahaemolyticus M0605]|jgi:hypothetical protein|nr:hypothetical protein AJ90_21065 [Vibrio parahaemolyticus M0605]